jgi:hypothetical protein
MNAFKSIIFSNDFRKGYLEIDTIAQTKTKAKQYVTIWNTWNLFTNRREVEDKTKRVTDSTDMDALSKLHAKKIADYKDWKGESPYI